MKKNMNEKIRLVLTLTVCVLFIVVAFSNVVGKPQSENNLVKETKEGIDLTPDNNPKPTGLFNFRILNRDWNYWSNKPHLFSMPEGNVGIGTENPVEKLDVVGTVQMTGFKMPIDASNGYVLMSDDSGIGTWQLLPSGEGIGGNGTLNYIPKFLGTTTIGESIIYEKNNNIGVGVENPNSKLEVDGIIHSTSGGLKFPDETIQTTSASGDGHSLDASDGSPTDAVYVNEEGNVGIGTTSPNATLEVSGTMKVFGEWNDSIEFNTVYQAETDGFVSAWISVPNDHNNYYYLLEAYTDENNPPTTMRACDEIMHHGTPSELYGSILMPVKNGDYWKVKNYPLYGGSPCPGEIYWLPLGT